MNVLRRALAAAAITGTALAGAATVGATAAQAATAAPTHLAIAVMPRHVVTFGQPVSLRGKLTLAGRRAAVADAAVYLVARQSARSPWRRLHGEKATTGQDGSVTFPAFAPTRTEQVRLMFPGWSAKPALRSSVSAVRTIKVAYAVAASLTGDTLDIGVLPGAKGQTVLVQMRRGQRWHTVGHAKLDRKTGAMATFTIKPPKAKGAYKYRVVKPASHRYLTGVSAGLTLTVP